MEPLPPPPPPDGLPERDAGAWVEDKLMVVQCYLRGFVVACGKKARHWHYVDAMAGPGINRVRDSGERFPGSPLLALQAEPPFHVCLFMDNLRGNITALEARTAAQTDRREVRRGDANSDLIPFMEEYLDTRSPTLCLFDPEGGELHWSTVEAVARFKDSKYKVEQLILFPMEWLVRTLPTQGVPMPGNVALLNDFFGHENWQGIYERRIAGEINPDEARTAYLRLFANGLKRLDYRHVEERPVFRRGREGHIMYHLLFATDHDAGQRIMRWCFDHVWREEQQHLPGLHPPPPERRLTP